MQPLTEYLHRLHERGVTLWVENGQLRYRASRGGLGPQELAQLRLHKQSIMAELTRQAPDTQRQPTHSENTGNETLPLSFQQQWLLSLLQRHKDWNATQTFALKITGPLDRAILRQCLEAIRQRHGALRTLFVRTDPQPRQQITELRESCLSIVPADSPQEDKSHTRLVRQIRALADRPNRSAGEPPVHFWLISISEREHCLAMGIHRLAADCLSVSRIFQELWLLYGDHTHGRLPSLPEHPMQYGTYALQQHATADDWQRKHGAYWNKRLANASAIRWPVESCGVTDSANLLGMQQLSLGHTLSTKLRELARLWRTLPAVIALTFYVAVVSRWRKQRDLVVSFNIAGRHSEHEGTVGCFSHILYLRMELTGEETFADLVKLVSGEFYRGISHQDCGRMTIDRPELLGGMLFQWQAWRPGDIDRSALSTSIELPELTVENVRFQQASDLTTLPPDAATLEVTFFEDSDAIDVCAIYNKRLFTDDTIQRFISDLRRVAERVAHDPSSTMTLD